MALRVCTLFNKFRTSKFRHLNIVISSEYSARRKQCCISEQRVHCQDVDDYVVAYCKVFTVHAISIKNETNCIKLCTISECVIIP